MDLDLVTRPSFAPEGCWLASLEDFGLDPVPVGEALRLAGDFGCMDEDFLTLFGVFGILRRVYFCSRANMQMRVLLIGSLVSYNSWSDGVME